MAGGAAVRQQGRHRAHFRYLRRRPPQQLPSPPLPLPSYSPAVEHASPLSLMQPLRVPRLSLPQAAAEARLPQQAWVPQLKQPQTLCCRCCADYCSQTRVGSRLAAHSRHWPQHPQLGDLHQQTSQRRRGATLDTPERRGGAQAQLPRRRQARSTLLPQRPWRRGESWSRGAPQWAPQNATRKAARLH